MIKVTEDGVTAARNSNGEVEDLKRITLDESFGEPSRIARIAAGKSPVRYIDCKYSCLAKYAFRFPQSLH